MILRQCSTLAPALMLLLSTLACNGDAPTGEAVPAPEEVLSPAGPGSGEPNLSVTRGKLYLSWLEPVGEEQHVLRFAVWEGGGWSDPLTIAEGANFFVNWADFPSVVALPDGRLAAHWLVRSGGGTYAYDVHIAQSTDGGRSWSEAVVPHTDGTKTEHGFVSMFPWAEDQLAAVWLDGRNFPSETEHEPSASTAHGSAEMTLRHAALDAAGNRGPETVLDERVCDCCQTSAAITTQGPLVVYRDRSVDEIRDIYAVRYVDGRWTEPRPVHQDAWRITGCPVNGPAVDADGDVAAVAWFTAAADTPRVHIAFSSDAGATFTAPVRVDDGDPIGRVDVVMHNGAALVTWLERADDGAEIRVRRVRPDGSVLPAQVISRSTAQRAGGFPRMAAIGDEIVFAWTDASEPGGVRTAVARSGAR